MARVGFKLKRFARYIGLYKRTLIMDDGVRYRERSGVSLRRALGEHGSGVKEYDVRFPWANSESRRGMRIRYTASRLYDDVGHDPRTVLYAQLHDGLTPGLRVLEIGCGTGSGSAILAQAVGPSGGLVAVDRDGEAIRFARQRHRAQGWYSHCGFENGWTETLDGETDGGFDVVVAVDLLRGVDDPSETARMIVEVGRVIRGGGRLVLVGSSRVGGMGGMGGLEDIRDAFEGCGFTVERELSACQRSNWRGVVLVRDGDAKPRAVRDRHTPGSFQY